MRRRDMPDKELGNLVRAGFGKLCSEFTERLARLGFCRTRKIFWTRAHSLTVDLTQAAQRVRRTASMALRTASTLRCTSISRVRQLHTDTRIQCLPRQCVPVKKASPVLAIAWITARVKRS